MMECRATKKLRRIGGGLFAVRYADLKSRVAARAAGLPDLLNRLFLFLHNNFR